MPDSPPDSVSIDVSNGPARLLAHVAVPTGIIGPPQSVALAPDLSIAIVSAATKYAPGDHTRTVDGDQLSVVDLQASGIAAPRDSLKNSHPARAPA